MRMKRIIIICVVLAMAALMASCGLPGPKSPSSSAESPIDASGLMEGVSLPAIGAGADKEAEKYSFSVVLPIMSGDFTAAFIAGAEDAGKALNCKIDVKGPRDQNHAEEAEIIKDAIRGGADGVAAVCGDKEAFREAAGLADRYNVKFVTFNMDEGGDPPGTHPGYGSAYAGPNEYGIARSFANKFWEKVGDDADSYIIVTAGKTLPVCITRTQAIKDASAKAGKKLAAVVEIGYDEEKCYDMAAKAIDDNPGVDAIIGTDMFSVYAARAVGDKGHGTGGDNEKIYVGCFDPLPETIDCLISGSCDMIADQNPYLQSWYAVFNLYSLVKSGRCAVNTDTGLTTWGPEDIFKLKVLYSG